MFHTGRPIGTGPGPSWHAQAVTSTDASVGPYRLCSAGPRIRNARAARSAGSTSPLHSTRRSPAAVPAASGAARKARSIDGTKWTVVTAWSRMTEARYAGSLWPSGRARTSRAPVISGQKNSHTETSKPAGVFWSTASVGSSR